MQRPGESLNAARILGVGAYMMRLSKEQSDEVYEIAEQIAPGGIYSTETMEMAIAAFSNNQNTGKGTAN